MNKFPLLKPRWLLFLVSSALLSAAPVIPTEYSLLNGENGTWVYKDTTYLPCPAGNCQSSLASLSGGTGKLTDGNISSQSWHSSGQWSGTSVPWVGWYSVDPTINFSFAQPTTISRISLYFDNTPGNGDVRLPGSIQINGNIFDIVADPNHGPRWMSFDIGNYVGNSIQLGLTRDNGNWMMLGEVAFDGASSVPEPATMGLFGLAFGAFSLSRFRALRRARQQ